MASGASSVGGKADRRKPQATGLDRHRRFRGAIPPLGHLARPSPQAIAHVEPFFPNITARFALAQAYSPTREIRSPTPTVALEVNHQRGKRPSVRPLRLDARGLF